MLIFQLDLLEKKNIFEFYQGVWIGGYIFLNVSYMEQIQTFSLDWNVDELNMQRKFQIMFLDCRLPNWLISKAIGLYSFDKICVEMFIVKLGSDVKMICLFD